MAAIYIMAILSTILAVGLWVLPGAILAGNCRRFVWLTLVSLPFSALINLLVKQPLLAVIGEAFGFQVSVGPPPFFWMCCLFTSPLTEEAIKAVPVFVSPLRGCLHAKGTPLWAGLFLGIGFGLGEIWYLAWTIAQAAEYAATPWWGFTGFLTERVLVTLIHGVMTAVVITGIGRGGIHIWLGYLYGVGLHAFTNMGALLFQMELIPMVIAGAWIFIPFTLLLLLFALMYRDYGRSEQIPL